MCEASPGLGLEDRIVWLPLDLSVMRLARKAGEELLSKETRLDILGQSSVLQVHVAARTEPIDTTSSGSSLVNNAAWATRDYELSEDGIEKAVAVKFVALCFLTTFFLPNFEHRSVVISVTSYSQTPSCLS